MSAVSVQSISPEIAVLLLERVQRLNPALAAYISEIAACDICVDVRHEWREVPHADHDVPVVSSARYSQVAEDLASQSQFAGQAIKTASDLGDALSEFWAKHETDMSEAAAMYFEDEIIARLAAAGIGGFEPFERDLAK